MVTVIAIAAAFVVLEVLLTIMLEVMLRVQRSFWIVGEMILAQRFQELSGNPTLGKYGRTWKRQRCRFYHSFLCSVPVRISFDGFNTSTKSPLLLGHVWTAATKTEDITNAAPFSFASLLQLLSLVSILESCIGVKCVAVWNVISVLFLCGLFLSVLRLPCYMQHICLALYCIICSLEFLRHILPSVG